jgi:hypothetical protein
VLVSAVVFVWAVVLVKVELYAGTVGESTTASGAAAALDATTKSDSMSDSRAHWIHQKGNFVTVSLAVWPLHVPDKIR